MLSRRGFSGLIASLGTAATLAAQHMPDRSFRPMIEDRAYAIGTGPVVCADDSHNNVYTLTNGFFPFGDLDHAATDTWCVTDDLTDQPSRDGCRILVIASPSSTRGSRPAASMGG